MKSLVLALSLFIACRANSQTLQWTMLVGTSFPSSSILNPFHLCTDDAGYIYSSGWFSGTVDFDPSPSSFTLNSIGASCYVCKYDANGSFIWAVNVAGIAGGSNGRIELTVDPSGNVYVLGIYNGTCDFDPGSGTFNATSSAPNQTFLLKLDAAGNFVWVKFPPKGIFITGLRPDGLGNLVAAGSFSGTVDFSWGNNTSVISSNGMWDAFVQKINGQGTTLSVKTLGSATSSVYPSKLYGDPQGNPAICGSYTGTLSISTNTGPVNYSSSNLQMFAVYLDAASNFISSFTVNPQNGSSQIGAYNFDSGGNLIAVGQFTGVCDFDFSPSSTTTLQANSNDCFALKLNRSGAFQWVKSLATKLYPIDIKSDNASQVVIAGVFTGSVDTDPGPASNVLDSISGNCLLWSLNAAGNYVSAINSSRVVEIATLLDGALVTQAPAGTQIRINRYGSLYTGINKIDQAISNINVFPNPSADQVTIESAQLDFTSLQLYSLNGERLFEVDRNATNKTLDVSQLPDGIYLINLLKDGRIKYSAKLIKQ